MGLAPGFRGYSKIHPLIPVEPGSLKKHDGGNANSIVVGGLVDEVPRALTDLDVGSMPETEAYLLIDPVVERGALAEGAA